MKPFRFAAILLCGLSLGCASQRQALRAPSVPASQEQRKTVYFDFDRTEIRKEERSKLEEIARWLSRDKKAIAIVEGHADQIGDARYNEILSEDRARSVRVYLRDEGADPRRMTVLSKGEREPLVKGKGRRVLQPNRRVEVYMNLTPGED